MMSSAESILTAGPLALHFADLAAREKKMIAMSIYRGGVRRHGKSKVSHPGRPAGHPSLPPQEQELTMRFMILVKADKNTEAGALPDEQMLTEMGKFNEQLVKAGVLLAGEGLHPTSKGARVKFTGTKPSVIDGPFSEAKELVAGFWMIQVKSKQEAIEWIKRAPMKDTEVEIRQVFEASDFGDALTPELREAEDKLRATVESQRH
jgi:hypothetical protein